MEVTTGNQLLDPNLYPQNHPSLPTDLEANFDQNSFGAYALNNLANASVNHQQTLGQNDLYNQSSQHPQLRLQRTRFQPRPDGSPTTQSPYAQSHHSASPQNHDDPYGIPNRLHFSPNTTLQNGSPQQPLYMPIQRLQQGQQNTPGISPTSTSPQHATPTNEDGTKSHFAGMQIVKDPPHLGEWRERLFNIQGTVTMTEQEFQIYFPHIDNVYSHRSTQKYKRRPFVSHYWDCRLKGRPSGTPKSDDPNKKKRKRTARERDLCDVKIKITEYFPTTSDWQGTPNGSNGGHSADGSNLTFISENQSQQQDSLSDSAQPFGVLAPPSTLPPGHPGANGARYYTIQMVNGNISGNDTNSPADSGPACMHKHSLLDSDKIKKNSVQRHFLKEEKEAKRMSSIVTTNTNPNPASSPPKRKPGTASGPASITKNLHALVPSALPGGPLILFANSYCPFAQRIWIALEIKRLPYQYVEVIPAHMQGGTVERPQELLEICPEGIVPCLKHGKWGIWESGVCLEYLEDLTSEAAGMNRLEAHAAENWLLPPGDARLKAWSRLWVDHINRKILPAFYHLLLAPPVSNDTDPSSADMLAHRTVLTNTLTTAITTLVNASHATGPFFLGPTISYVDVMFAPWVLRLSRVLTRYRGYEFSSALDQRWQAWVSAIESDERVRATTSEPASYADVYSDVGECGVEALRRLAGQGPLKGERKLMAELSYARNLLGQEGFGLGGDVWGRNIDVDSQAFRHSVAVGLRDDPHMLGR